MPRSRSSYTASPTRFASPQRSPARRPPTEDGSHYEIDLSALGHNSTFESTDLEAKHAPVVDVVDTSDIDGPDDFTANLTYYMTADLPLSQIKSRKEATSRIAGVRGDAMRQLDGQDLTEESDRAVIEDSGHERKVESQFDSGSPTVRANGTSNSQEGVGGDHSEVSMENDEKVISYLSALPDTETQDFVTSTPLRLAKQDLLRPPSHSPPKARSLQATVEDYDTPRKPTQETVIHHVREPSTQIDNTVDSLQDHIAALEARLEQQELAAKTRITELETILTYTRAELDTSRAENYNQRERIGGLEEGERRRKDEGDIIRSMEAQLKAKDADFSRRLEEFGEELRLQTLAKMQKQREDFERQLAAAEEAKRLAEAQVAEKDGLLVQLRNDLSQAEQQSTQNLESLKATQTKSEQDAILDKTNECAQLTKDLSSLQTLADTLQSDLEKATSEARAARQEADAANTAAHTARQERNSLSAQSSTSQSDTQVHTRRISDLESQLTHLQSQLATSRQDVNEKDRQLLSNIEEHERIEQRLSSAQGRIEGLEKTISTLRQQLSDAHREGAKAQADVERLTAEANDASERLADSKKEMERKMADVDRKLVKMKELKLEAEDRYKEVQSELESLKEEQDAEAENVRSKAEDAVRKAGALLDTERKEKKHLAKELKVITAQLERLKSEAAQKAELDKDDDQDVTELSSHSDPKEAEIENLRMLLRRQAAAMKTLKAEHSSMRKEVQSSKARQTQSSDLHDENAALHAKNKALTSELNTLRNQLSTQRSEFEAVNKAMDERLASLISKVLKERSKTVVSQRDSQWTDAMEKLKEEKELRGRLLLREWGKQECGIAPEKENQLYKYKYVKRS